MKKSKFAFGTSRTDFRGKEAIPEEHRKKNRAHTGNGPNYSELMEVIHRLEQEKMGKPDIDDLKEKLSQRHGRNYTKEEVRQQLEYLEKTPANHKIVKRSLIREKVSLTTYGQQVLEQ